MKFTRLLPATLTLGLTLGLIGACSTSPTDAPSDPTPAAVQATPAPAATTEASKPVETEAAAAPKVGDTVDAADIDAARAAGAHVFVAPGEKTGVVIDPKDKLPKKVVQAAQDAVDGHSPRTLKELGAMYERKDALRDSLKAAGTGVWLIMPAGEYDSHGKLISTGYGVMPVNLPEVKDEYNAVVASTTRAHTKASAVAQVQKLIDKTGAPVIDGTL